MDACQHPLDISFQVENVIEAFRSIGRRYSNRKAAIRTGRTIPDSPCFDSQRCLSIFLLIYGFEFCVTHAAPAQHTRNKDALNLGSRTDNAVTSSYEGAIGQRHVAKRIQA